MRTYDGALAARRLRLSLSAITRRAGGPVGIALVDVGGRSPQTVSISASTSFTAGSTYKLPALMALVQSEVAGRVRAADQECFQPQDYEPGIFGDYSPGRCYSFTTLARRAGHFSDNTAGHMLVRRMGGDAALNAYAHRHGARHSQFASPNTTTAGDLAALLVSVARGGVGGSRGLALLAANLTHTAYEDGIPAGLPRGTRVVHKIGFYNGADNDAALVLGPRGWFVLTVTTQGLADPHHTQAAIAAAAWSYETHRPQ